MILVEKFDEFHWFINIQAVKSNRSFQFPSLRKRPKENSKRKKERNEFQWAIFSFPPFFLSFFFFFSAFPFRNRWFLLVRSNRTTNAGMNQNLVLKIHSPLYTANLFDTRTNTANQLGTPAVVVILLVCVCVCVFVCVCVCISWLNVVLAF